MPLDLRTGELADHLVAFLSCFVNDLEEEEEAARGFGHCCYCTECCFRVVSCVAWEVVTGRDFDPYWTWCETTSEEISRDLNLCSLSKRKDLGGSAQ